VKVVVLAGGWSSERNVSLASSKAMALAVGQRGHEVITLDAATGQTVTWLDGPIGSSAPTLNELSRIADPSKTLAELIQHPAVREADLVVNGLHGGIGENGVLQGLLDTIGKTYTGSGVLASALAMNKYYSKRLFESTGIKTPTYLFFKQPLDIAILTERLKKEMRLPMVVKPNEEGSTVGLSIVREWGELDDALEQAARFGDVLVEWYIEGREITVAVLGGEALPVIEIIPKGGFYDYEHKYTRGMTDYVCPADLLTSQADKVRHFAKLAHQALGCEGYSRVDFRMGADNLFYCLEVNTLPGMTETSLVPKAARAAGMDFETLMEKIMQLALDRS
jgi:D-alanine-D-alanine ligase